MNLRFSHKLFLACLLSAATSVALGVAFILWRHPTFFQVEAAPGPALLLLAGIVALSAAAAAFYLNRELQRTLAKLHGALEQFSRGGAPAVDAPWPANELGQLLGEVNARLSELAVLRETMLDLTAEMEMAPLLQTIVERAVRLMGVSGGVVYEANIQQRRLRPLALVSSTYSPPAWDIEFGEGVVGRVAESGESLAIANYQSWPGRSERFADYPLFNVLGVPMHWRGQLIGVLSLEDEAGGRVFTGLDVALAEQFANLAAAAIGNARLYADATREAERLAILHTASQAISRSLDLEQAYEAIYRAVGQLMPTEAFAIALLDEHGRQIETAFLIDQGERQPNFIVPAEAGLTGHVIRAGHPVLLRSTDEWPEGVVHYGGEPSVQSVLATPLRAGEHVFGALTTQSYQPNAFIDEDLPLLVMLANQAASAITNARLFESIERQLAQLSILHDVAQAAVSTADSDQVIRGALAVLRERVAYDYLGLYLLAPAGDELRLHPSTRDMYPGRPFAAEIDVGAGLVGQVAATGQARRGPEGAPADAEACSVLGVPLKVGERVIGVLNAEAEAPKVFGVEDERLLTIVAGLLAPIIEMVKLYEHDRERLNQLSLLNEITLAAVSAPDFDAVVTQAVRVLQQRLNYEIVGVALVDETGNWLYAHPSYVGLSQPEAVNRIRITEGIMGAAARTGRAVRVDDVGQDERYRPGVPDVRSELAVPLVVSDRVIGVLNSESRRLSAYDDTDEQLLTVVAGLLAPILENARLRDRAQQQARDLDWLYRAQAAASASLDPQAVLGAIVEHLGRALGVTSAYVLELVETQAQKVAEHYGAEATTLERVSGLNKAFPIKTLALASRAMRTNQPLFASPHDPGVSEAERDYLLRYGARTTLIVPLLRHGRPLGYVELWETRHARAFSERELQLAQSVAAHAASALENAKLYQAAQRRAEQMALVNEVGQTIASILDADDLIEQVSQRLESTFGYYHAGVGWLEGDQVVFPARYNRRRQITVPVSRYAVDGPGLIAWVARQAQPRLVPDVAADSDFTPDPYFPHTQAEAVLPLRSHSQLVAVLDVKSDRIGGLTADDLAALEAVSGQLGVALENARLFAEARQRADEVSALLATTLSLSSSMNLDSRLESIAQFARRLVDADSCIIYKLEAAARLLRPLTVHDRYAEQIQALTIAVGEGITGHVALTGKGEMVNRVDLDPRGKQVPGTPVTPESLIAVPLRVGGRITGVMSVYREGPREFKAHEFNLITSFAAQAAVAIESAELYQALEERANVLQSAYDELAEMDRHKDEVVQNISHELRTPITFLKSYVDMLLAGEFGELLPEQAKSLRVVAEKTATLVRLVNDIFVLQTISPETLKPVAVDLAALARTAVEGMAAAAQADGLHILTEIPGQPIYVRGDQVYLSQVLDNLLSNALKFTAAGGRIQLEVYPDADTVRVNVRDTGVGISTDHLKRIFERFYQADGVRARRRGGLGLGLAISKQIVESHRGQIGVESKLGRGSCFYMVLPLWKDAPAPAEAPDEAR